VLAHKSIKSARKKIKLNQWYKIQQGKKKKQKKKEKRAKKKGGEGKGGPVKKVQKNSW